MIPSGGAAPPCCRSATASEAFAHAGEEFFVPVEPGWQLSHGERSRIFVARALLQGAKLTVMDESFAALDPEVLERCLACAISRARSLVVIAHP
jgi:ABC-type multidrug transport system fused ATPase/permease subunit